MSERTLQTEKENVFIWNNEIQEPNSSFWKIYPPPHLLKKQFTETICSDLHTHSIRKAFKKKKKEKIKKRKYNNNRIECPDSSLNYKTILIIRLAVAI